MVGGELRVAADRGCGVVLGGVTCVSGRQKELLETPERWAEIFAEKHFGGTGNDLVGGCSTVTMGPWGENMPELAQPTPFFGLQPLVLRGMSLHTCISQWQSV